MCGGRAIDAVHRQAWWRMSCSKVVGEPQYHRGGGLRDRLPALQHSGCGATNNNNNNRDRLPALQHSGCGAHQNPVTALRFFCATRHLFWGRLASWCSWFSCSSLKWVLSGDFCRRRLRLHRSVLYYTVTVYFTVLLYRV